MSGLDLKMQGVGAALQKLAAKPLKVQTQAHLACIRGAHVLEGAMKMKAPVGKTGFLRNSISVTPIHNGAEVGPRAEYAVYQEYGTGKYAKDGKGRKTPWAYEDPLTGEVIWTAGNRPHPFVQPAIDEKKKEVERIVKAAIEKELKR